VSDITFHYLPTSQKAHYKMSTQDGNSQPLFPTLCKNGCGFFSGIDSKGFCSVCYKKYLKKEAADNSEAGEADDTTSAVLAQLSLEETPAKIAPEEVEVSKAEIEVAVAEVKAEAIAAEEPSPSLTDGGACALAVEKEEEKEEPKETKKKKNRCFSCKKKLGLTGFSCRCGGLFCAVHRYSDKHECNFDYKAMGEKEISEANPLIVAAKVAKI